METLSRVSWVQFSSSSSSPAFGAGRSSNHCLFFPKSCHSHNPHISMLRIPIISVLKTPSSASELAEDDVLQDFFRDRKLNGDLVTKFSDILFERRVIKYDDAEATEVAERSNPINEGSADEPEGGFLKLKKTQEWLLGETSAPINKKPTSKELQDNRERIKRLNLLQYEALKKELLFMTLGVGAACTVYCFVTFSVQAALSYASGVGLSCLYLQLLCKHADSMSKDSIPQIFLKKKPKRIGIRSEDLEDLLEKTVSGGGIALSSSRLVIPAAIYGLWVLLHRNFASDVFDFQIVPAMLGLFAYKAAALVQVYRDNEDLRLIFADDEDNPKP